MKIVKIICLFLIAVLLCGMSALAEESVLPESIKIILSKTEMQIGETQKIKVSLIPGNAGNYELEYYSSNPQVITAVVGTLIAVAEGASDIAVRVKDTEILDTVTVIVKQDTSTVLVSDIELEDTVLYIERYEEQRIYYTVIPSSATDQNISFVSQNTAVATVDENGIAYGKKTGNTQIQVQSADGQVTKFVRVYVTDEDEATESDSDVPVHKVDIYHAEDEVIKTIEVMRTQAVQFTAQISPESATDKRIRWKSADEGIAEVDENGIVTGITEGSVKIYAIARDNGRQDTITVKVVPYVRKPDSISIVLPENPVYETGNIIALKAALLPIDTTETNVHWCAYGGNAAIDNNGNLTLTDRGKAEVMAYTSDYKQSAALTIDVKYSPDHFILVKESIGVKQGRAILMTFDKNVDAVFAADNIFVTSDSGGNGDKTEIDISVHGNILYINPKVQWPLGENYAFIKGGLRDADETCILKNYKYKFVTRSVST